MAIFDTHAHYDSNAFKSDRDEVLTALPDAGVGLVVNAGCDIPSSKYGIQLAERYPHVYAAAGIHPSDCGDCTDADIAAVRELCRHPKVVAVGEIGLDYYWQDNPSREFQQKIFRQQIEVALELDLPVIVHDREAHGDTMAVLFDYPKARGVVHCFSGSPEMARELVKRGWYLGFDGPVTYKNAKKGPEVLAETPLDRIVIETDAPYLTPVPYRGKRNDSRYLPYVVEKLAEWKSLSPGEMERITWENGLRLYGLKGKV